MLFLRWLISGTVRQATELRSHVRKYLRSQLDILAPEAVEKTNQALSEIDQALRTGADTATLKARMKVLEDTANQWLIPHPNASWRENVEVVLVAVAIAMSIRTFFLQPMKIPTGSMQPTLYGITYENLSGKPDVSIPTGLRKYLHSIFLGTSYHHVVAKDDGDFYLLDPMPQPGLPFMTKQRFTVGGVPYQVTSPGDRFFMYAGITNGQHFRKGEDIIKMKVTSGDHLFVNRMVYNFKQPERGEIVIFETRGIQELPQDTFYIKRLVATSGDRIRIGNDQHLMINGQRLDAATPHFEFLYTFKDGSYEENAYFGHVNQAVGAKYARPGTIISPLFADANVEQTVRTNHYAVMGDNTMNSFDSRYWGDFPRENVIGRAGFVYWPISKRFGWGFR